MSGTVRVGSVRRAAVSTRFTLGMVAAGAALAALAACAANDMSPLPAVEVDGGRDGATDASASIEAGAIPVRVVVVNALTRAVAVGDAGDKARDVRLCFSGVPLALPSTGTMPLTNYPGIARGRGLDLGQISASGPVEIDVLDADAVHTSTANGACSRLTDPQEAPAARVASAKVSVALMPGVNLLVLRDGPNDGIVIEQAQLIGSVEGSDPDAGPQPIQGQYGVFSSWLAADASASVEAVDDAGVHPLAASLGPGQLGPPIVITVASPDGYEVSSLRFASGGDAGPAGVSQTLGSIQYVSDPTTSPAAFFERRASFVFVLVGDPADRTALADGGRKPSLDGAELHVLAVPYLR